MSYQVERNRRAFCTIGLLVCLAASSCQSRQRSVQAPEARDNGLPGPAPITSPSAAERSRARSLHGPLLLPLLDRVSPDHLSVERPGAVDLVVSGIRIRLRTNGRYEVGSGILPLARGVEVTRLPTRLGAGVLFALTSTENTWLLRAESFTSRLTPIGQIEVPTSAVSVGFEAIYATIKQTGIVVAIDPTSGRATESTLLPAAPEYGPVAIVDDWFGATMDPLRGLLLTRDAGQNWQRFSHAAIARADSIRAISVDHGRLDIERSDHQHFWLSPRGELQEANDSDRASAKPRSIRGMVQGWKLDPLGGWPIELAVSRGALLQHDLAKLLSRGILADVRLHDGAVLASRAVDVAMDRSCHAEQAGPETYFLCQGRVAMGVHRLKASGDLERLIEFPEKRELVSVSKSGLLWRGACDDAVRGNIEEYCAVRQGRTPETVQLSQPTGRERLAVVDERTVAVLQPPSETVPGRISFLGNASRGKELVFPKDCSEQQRTMLKRGFWLSRLYSEGDVLSSWVTLGDDLVGVQIAENGSMTIGEVVSGASRAVFSENRVILPDSSGYALESLDGGRSYLRPHLPVPIAATTGTLGREAQYYGCSRVGCRFGDWLRVGWSDPRHSMSGSVLEPVTAPDSCRIVRPRRRIPRLHCRIEGGNANAARGPMGPRQTDRESGRNDSGRNGLESTRFEPFYSIAPPALPATKLGFDRGWRDERFALRGYARAPKSSGLMSSWSIDLRVSDPLHKRSIWSASAAEATFESAESVARAFAHPRYGTSATSWHIVADPDGDGFLWSIEDAGKIRAFLVEPGHDIVELTEVAGRDPRRISDVARLADGWYLLGTEPTPRLVAISGNEQRVLSETDPRARLRVSRLRMVRNRDRTRVAYLVLSARLRAVDVQWYVFPVHARTGVLDAPIVVPLERGIRPCDSDEDGWLFATSLDLIADVTLTSEKSEVSGQTEALVLLHDSGLCIDRILINGTMPKGEGLSLATRRIRADVSGRHVDEHGRMRQVACEIED